jgi:hypothetical protein
MVPVWTIPQIFHRLILAIGFNQSWHCELYNPPTYVPPSLIYCTIYTRFPVLKALFLTPIPYHLLQSSQMIYTVPVARVLGKNVLLLKFSLEIGKNKN